MIVCRALPGFKIEVLINGATKIFEASEEQIENLQLTEIKLGITTHGNDTKDPEIAESIEQHNVHPALIGFYLNPTGAMYRSCWSKYEKAEIIREYEEEQKKLQDLINRGFKLVNNEEALSTLIIVQ